MKKVWDLRYTLSAQRRLYSDVQADLSLHWAHSHFVGFIMPRLHYAHTYLKILSTEGYSLSWQSCSVHDVAIFSPGFQAEKVTEEGLNQHMNKENEPIFIFLSLLVLHFLQPQETDLVFFFSHDSWYQLQSCRVWLRRRKTAHGFTTANR